MPLEEDQVVFLGVKSGDDYAVAQIFVSSMDDDTFFEALREKYNRLRGVFRQYLSYEIYHCCEFVQVSGAYEMKWYFDIRC
jgi:ribosome-binding factor A